MNIHCPHCSAMLTVAAEFLGQFLICPCCHGQFHLPEPAAPPITSVVLRPGATSQRNAPSVWTLLPRVEPLFFVVGGILISFALGLIAVLVFFPSSPANRPTISKRLTPKSSPENLPTVTVALANQDATHAFWMKFRSIGEPLLSLEADSAGTLASGIKNFSAAADGFRLVANRTDALLESSQDVDVELIAFAKRSRDVFRSVSKIFADTADLVRRTEAIGRAQARKEFAAISARMQTLGTSLENAGQEREQLRTRLAMRYGVDFPESTASPIPTSILTPIPSPTQLAHEAITGIATLRFWEEFRLGCNELGSKKMPGNPQDNLKHFNAALVGMGVGLRLQDRSDVDPELLKAVDDFILSTEQLGGFVGPGDVLAQTDMVLATGKLGTIFRLRETLEARYGLAFPAIGPPMR